MAKILFVRATPYDEDIDGYNSQGAGIARAFCQLGHDCDYLSFDKKKEKVILLEEHNGHTARVIQKKRIRFFRTGISLPVLKSGFLSNYDYVICREYNQLMTYLISRRHPNTSMYSGPYWNMFMIPFTSAVYDMFFNRKINKTCRCKFVKSPLAKAFLEKKGYSELIDVGVGLDVARFEGVTCTEDTAKIVRYMEDNRCLLYVGTIDKNKNISFLLRVFEQVLKKEPDVKLILIGKSKQAWFNKLLGKTDESYFCQVKKRFSTFVMQSVKHIERIDNPQLQYIYPRAKALLLPSIREIFGMVLLEAMYFGLPVITSCNGGALSLMKDETYGQMMTVFDEEVWSAGVIRYLYDTEYIEAVKEKGKELIRRKFLWTAIAGKMLESMSGQRAVIA